MRFEYERMIMEKILRYIGEKKEIIIENEVTDNINWESLFTVLDKNRIFLLGYSLLQKYIPIEYIKLYEDRVNKYRSIIKKQLNIIRKFNELSEKNIKCFFIKGVVLAHLIYGDVYLRDPGDIDVVIEEHEITFCKELLNQIGLFKTYFFENSDKVIRIAEPTSNKMGVFHELVFSQPFYKDDIFLEIKIYTSAIRKKYMKKFWENLSIVSLSEKCTIKTNSVLFSFIHLCANTYGNTERRFNVEDEKFSLRDYIDVIAFLRKYKNEIKWEKVLLYANEMELTHKIKNILLNVNVLIPNYISKSILEMFTLSDITYDVSCLENGAIVDWNSGLMERLLFRTETVLEYRRLYMERLLGNKNKYFDKPYVINSSIMKEFQLVTTSKDAGVDIRYRFGVSKNNFIINILFTQKEYLYFVGNQMYIEFHMFCCDEALIKRNVDIHKILKYYVKDGVPYAECGTLKGCVITKIIMVKLEQQYSIEIFINKQQLFGTHKLVPYNIFVFEREFPNTVPILTGVRFSEKDDEEETTDMEILAIN